MRILYPQQVTKLIYDRNHAALEGKNTIIGAAPGVSQLILQVNVDPGKIALFDAINIRAMRSGAAGVVGTVQVIVYLVQGANYYTLDEIIYTDNTVGNVYSSYQFPHLVVRQNRSIVIQYTDQSTGGNVTYSAFVTGNVWQA